MPRGPVIGPMVLGGVIIDEKGKQLCRELNIRDSKLISPKRREFLFDKIKEFAVEVHFVKISAREIDKQRKKMSLNELEALKVAELIKKFKTKPDLIVIDLPDPTGYGFIHRISKYIKIDSKIKAEHKADVNYPSVSSASIIAKVIRDKEIEKLKEKYGEIGCLPYSEKILIEDEKGNRKFIEIGELVEDIGGHNDVFSLNKNLALSKSPITGYFDHISKDLYSVKLNNGFKIKMSSNHPLFILDEDASVVPKPLSRLCEGEFVASCTADVNSGLKSINLFELLSEYSSYNSPIYLESTYVSSLFKKKGVQEITKVAMNKGYARTSVYSWRRTNLIPIHILNKLINYADLPRDSALRSWDGRFKIPVNFKITKEFMWLLGLYIAEGSLNNFYRISIAAFKKKVINKMVECLNFLKFPYTFDRDGITINSVVLNKLFRAFNMGNYANEKKVPRFVFSLSKQHINAFLEGYFDGDGFKTKYGIQRAETRSKVLAEQLCQLLVLTGKASSINGDKIRMRYTVSVLGRNSSLSPYNLPSSIGVLLRKIRKSYNLSSINLSRLTGVSKRTILQIENKKVKTVQRKILLKILKSYNQKDKRVKKIIDLLNSNLYWVKIDEIKKIGNRTNVYDISVNPNENFVHSSGLLLHNSGYPADPKTKKFLTKNVDKGFDFIRYSWETARRLKKEEKQSKLNEF